MPFDPWSRPTFAELHCLDAAGRGRTEMAHVPRTRFPCRVPAELITARGNSVSAMTQEIGPENIALIHKGIVPLGGAALRLSHDREPTDRHALVVRTTPCDGGLYLTQVVIPTAPPSPPGSF